MMQDKDRKTLNVAASSRNVKDFRSPDTNIAIWEHPQIWFLDYEPSCSLWLLNEIEKLKEAIKEFTRNGYSIRYACGYDYSFLRNLAYNISQTGDFKTSLIKALKWKGKLGFECAVAELKHFRAVYGRIPTALDFHSIEREADKGRWKMLGIRDWNGLLRIIFGFRATQEKHESVD